MKSRFLFITYLILLSSFIGCQDTIEMDIEETEPEIPEANVLLTNGGCPDTLIPVYQASEGVISIEMESSSFEETQWAIDSTIAGASNLKYLVWKGSDNFGVPGKGLLTFKVKVEDTGTYRFLWRSRITKGSSNTEHNDSWLRIPDAAHFYGRKNNHIVYPNGSPLPPIEESMGQTNTRPAGSSSKGWFKIYMNTLSQWKWSSRTSDHDPHEIFAVFDDAGEYTIEISGRSAFHGIDRFVLFREGIPIQEATSSEQQLSAATCN